LLQDRFDRTSDIVDGQGTLCTVNGATFFPIANFVTFLPSHSKSPLAIMHSKCKFASMQPPRNEKNAVNTCAVSVYGV
jgi:hypothetical protein